MIILNFGNVKVEGLKPVVMAELVSLLKCLRNSLGEADYNCVLQDVNNSKLVEDEQGESDSEEKKTEFEPHLIFENIVGSETNYGPIGDETNICDIAGRKLSVGDTVDLYTMNKNAKLDYCGERSIVRVDDEAFVMGVKGVVFDRGINNVHVEWVIILNRRNTEVVDGETVNNIKYIKTERTGK